MFTLIVTKLNKTNKHNNYTVKFIKHLEKIHHEKLTEHNNLFSTHIRKAHDEIVNVGPLGGLDHLVHAGLPRTVPVPDVARYGPVKQYGLLLYHAHLPAQHPQLHAPDVLLHHFLQWGIFLLFA